MKRTTTIIISSIVALVIIVIGVFESQKKPETVTTESAIQGDYSKTSLSDDPALAIDSDHDGLRDWEEVLWKTDSKIADTDGDGTNDGDEVKAGRNPLIAGPDDLLQTPNATANATSGVLALSATDKFSISFFQKYMIAKQKGAITSESAQAIINETLAEGSLNNRPEITLIAPSAIKASADTSPEAVKSYFNALGKIIITNSPMTTSNELDLVQEILKERNVSKEQELKKIGVGYTNVYAESKKMVVPASLVALHANFINSFNTLAVTITGMSTLIEDPVAGIQFVNEYRTGTKLLGVALSEALVRIKENHITFGDKEYGSMFAKNI
jgi:hypothetical protein